MKLASKKSVAVKPAKKAARVEGVSRLYNRCLMLQVGKASIELKVMGDDDKAHELREDLIFALEATGVTVIA